MYVEDPHPGEPGFREFSQPADHTERRAYAKRLADERGMRAKVVVDEMDDAVWKLYGSLPNMVYVIDRDGTVAYHATWTLPATSSASTCRWRCSPRRRVETSSSTISWARPRRHRSASHHAVARARRT